MSNATELLRRALNALEFWYPTLEPESEPLLRDIRAYLTAEPEAEPVAWTNPEELGALKDEVSCYMYAEPLWGNKDIPLYTRPSPARKPMTEEEIDSKFELDGSMFSSYTAFKQGVRLAEKQHGIGGDDGN